MKNAVCLVALLLALALAVWPTHADDNTKLQIYSLCNENSYEKGSSYGEQVKKVEHLLTQKTASSDGFLTITRGEINGLMQCRGDISEDDCRSCTESLVPDLSYNCPKALGAREQLSYCFLRYENYTFANVLNTTVIYPFTVGGTNTGISGFGSALLSLMRNLTQSAPTNAKRFAGGSHAFNSTLSLYGAQECYRSLSSADCKTCLKTAVKQLMSCCSSELTGMLYLGSCYARFATAPL